jgi:hypothetical protein
MMGGTAVAVGLPMLEAMLNSNGTALAGGEALPTRFMTWFFGNGVILDRFEPTMSGENWELTEQLMPLAPNKDYINLCTGYRNRCEQLITHHEGMTAFTASTMVQVQGLFSKVGSPTIDQLIANAIGEDSIVKSLQVSVSKRMSVMDGGTTMYALSHADTEQPLYPENDPQKVWQQLFGNFVPAPDDDALRQSILDSVREDTIKLQNQLGAHDQQRLEAHLDSIASLQAKIAAMPPMCDLPPMPTEDNTDIMGEEPLTSVNNAMNELIAYAFQCDITRVASMLFTGGAAETVFSNLGQFDAHHDNTHNWPAREEEINAVVVYLMERFNDLLTVLRNTEDLTGGNLLDSTMIYCSSDCSQGWSHSVDRQPIILAGHGRNKLKYPGVHYSASPNGQGGQGNMSDVLLTCLQAFDPTAIEIGIGDPRSTTPNEEIKGLG